MHYSDSIAKKKVINSFALLGLCFSDCYFWGKQVGVSLYFFSHTFVEKIEISMNLLPVCKLYPTLLALLSHTASSVANAG